MHAKPRAGRPLCIPPAPFPRSDSDLPNVSDTLALAFWRALRTVHLWIATPHERRARAFRAPTSSTLDVYAGAVVEAPELDRAFETFAEVQRRPESIGAADVARACHAVYAWADNRGLLEVAAHFGEAAAYADPEHPAYAVDAGWSCRRLHVGGFLSRSAAWYQRAFALSVRHRSRHDSLRALTGYGALMQELGNLSEARRAYLKAARRAFRTGRKRRAAVAHHYLFALTAEHGELAEAVEHARKAFRLYPIHDARLPYLAHDYAVFLLIRFNAYRPAFRLARPALSKMDDPDAIVMVAGTLAWAAGGAMRPDQFDSAERLAVELAPLYKTHAASALAAIGLGGCVLGRWDAVRRHASTALPLARERLDTWAEATSLELLAAVDSKEPSPPEGVPDARTLEVSRRLAARLYRWKGRGKV
jgi:tetratricopeptide (TPR) repeat protein